jgi:hypothetical protein
MIRNNRRVRLGEVKMNTNQESGTQENQNPSLEDGKQQPSQSDESSGSTPSNETSENSGKIDLSTLDPKVQKLISDLRNENANSRQKNKSLAESHGKLKQALIETGLIEDDSPNPEEHLKNVKAQNEVALFQNGILEAAFEYGVNKENLKYFQYLVSERLSQLQDEEELTEEDLSFLAQEARRGTSTNTNGSTSVDGKSSPKPGAPAGQVNLDQFVKMNIGEKTELFMKNKELYTTLMSEAKSKRMIV